MVELVGVVVGVESSAVVVEEVEKSKKRENENERKFVVDVVEG